MRLLLPASSFSDSWRVSGDLVGTKSRREDMEPEPTFTCDAEEDVPEFSSMESDYLLRSPSKHL